MTDNQTPPRITERVKLAHTIKDGWRVDEISVILEHDLNDDTDEVFGNSLRKLHAEGDAFAAEKNAEKAAS